MSTPLDVAKARELIAEAEAFLDDDVWLPAETLTTSESIILRQSAALDAALGALERVSAAVNTFRKRHADAPCVGGCADELLHDVTLALTGESK